MVPNQRSGCAKPYTAISGGSPLFRSHTGLALVPLATAPIANLRKVLHSTLRENCPIKLDVQNLKIGVKNVRNIRNGGILIETESEEDLDKLIQEFKAQDDLNRDFNIQKPTMRKPHIICFWRFPRHWRADALGF
ncbi:hypothetical protein CEXT_702822 [Caerostris extrusa]|uniref:Uncharacterized protein n=1 Tax=Caerostris extrusa TaxID=172846 RepID=A0AAV4N9G1_CAEEX|nr:hypothetical protein CEXT_702822 [Caerostris extrusa]